jgi:hypothetical protein
MPPTQEEPKFTADEAQRFVALIAGFDIGNPSEPEAMAKARMMRRMASAKGLRIVDAFELPEIRRAIDEQMQPVRAPVPDVAALQAEVEDLRGKLAFTLPKLREVTERLTNERTELVENAALMVGMCVADLSAWRSVGIAGAVATHVVLFLIALVFCED